MINILDILSISPDMLSELIARLTVRQREVITLLVQGQSDKEVASLLSITQWTIKKHVYNACQRAGVLNRTQLIVAFVIWQITEKEKLA